MEFSFQLINELYFSYFSKMLHIKKVMQLCCLKQVRYYLCVADFLLQVSYISVQNCRSKHIMANGMQFGKCGILTKRQNMYMYMY